MGAELFFICCISCCRDIFLDLGANIARVELFFVHCISCSSGLFLDLGANIAGAKEEEIETSGVPSTNSGKSASLYRSSAVSELQSQLDSLQEENMQ